MAVAAFLERRMEHRVAGVLASRPPGAAPNAVEKAANSVVKTQVERSAEWPAILGTD